MSRPLTYAQIYSNLDGLIALQVACATPLRKGKDEKDTAFVKRIVATYAALAPDASQNAIRLLRAEDERQSKLHELLETIREQIRTEVDPEHRPDSLFKNIQDAVYAMRGRMPLLNDAAIAAVDDELIERVENILRSPKTIKAIVAHDPQMIRDVAAAAIPTDTQAMREALSEIANHPEKKDGNPSYAVGWAFWNMQRIARAALAAMGHRAGGETGPAK